MIFLLLSFYEPGFEPAVKIEKKKEEREFNEYRMLTLSIIRIYQVTLSGIMGDVCVFEPSCSHYGYQSIKKYGIFLGLLMTFDRLERCSPFARSYYPDFYGMVYVPGRGYKLYDPPEENLP
ncbi:hypothetical protein DRQ18_00305 [bacterium]|nr:MAG: hypothetical protein DRQ18_00305 [bacterium]